jgi:predicted dehydrogenase
MEFTMNTATRRAFLQTSSAAALASSTLAPRCAAAAEDTINIALVGCGGRGTGAAVNALNTAGKTKLIAMADVFEDRLQGSHKNLTRSCKDKVDVPAERQFLGMEAFKQAIDLLGPRDVALLTTPPAFRPRHLEYAVAKGVNVFMEKSFAVDGPGIRRVMAAGEEATRKNLKIAGGLMSRHYPPLEEAIKRIHDGAIGDVITCWTYREHGPVGFKPRREGYNEIAHQIRNYSCFTWINGSFMLDWVIHNLDVACWVKGAWPVSVQGQGGREVRKHPDQMYDHFSVEYTFPDGTHLMAQGRHMPKCWGFFGDVIHGTTGCALLGEGVSEPRLFKGHDQKREKLIWEYRSRNKPSPYQVEHDRFFDAIRRDIPYNETQRCAEAALTGIMGRMAAESGQRITREQALNSTLELAPGLDSLTMDSPAPVMPDADGNYPIPVPGFAKVL